MKNQKIFTLEKLKPAIMKTIYSQSNDYPYYYLHSKINNLDWLEDLEGKRYFLEPQGLNVILLQNWRYNSNDWDFSDLRFLITESFLDWFIFLRESGYEDIFLPSCQLSAGAEKAPGQAQSVDHLRHSLHSPSKSSLSRVSWRQRKHSLVDILHTVSLLTSIELVSSCVHLGKTDTHFN